MNRTTLATASTLLLALSASAQGLVSPASFATIEGNQSDSATIGGTSNGRYLFIHGDADGVPRSIRGITFRRDGVTTTPGEAFSMTVNAWISTAATNPTTPSATFANNHGVDKIQVLSFRVINFPATTAALPLPAAFQYAIAFDTPFSYGGTGPLAFELQVLGRTNTSAIALDACSGSSTNPPLTQVPFGAGCKGTGRTSQMNVTTTSTMSWTTGTGNLNVVGATAPAGAPVVIVLGTSNSSWSGIPLPFVLPGSETSPSGRCSLYTNPLLTIPTVANASGATPTLGIPIPATAEYAGATLYTQLWAIDPPAAFSLVTSNAASSHWVRPWTAVPVAKVTATNNASATGTATANNGLIARFDL